MKKSLLLITILGILILTGCQNSQIALKEKCSQFIEKAKVRYERAVFRGTFYSKTKDTCVSIYMFPEGTDIYDELTGHSLVNLAAPKEAYEQELSLDLLK